jgi:hypothetical protein
MSSHKESAMRHTNALFSFLLMAAFLAPASAWALSDAERQEEAETYAREDKEDEKMKFNPTFKTAFEGIVRVDAADISATPGPDAGARPEGVVGTFSFGGKDYLLKMESPRLIEDLRKVNGKSVTLTGKIRVNGKYFVAQSVLVPVPGPPRTTRGKRGGA